MTPDSAYMTILSIRKTMRIICLAVVCAVILSGCTGGQRAGQGLPKAVSGDWKAADSDWVISFDEKGQVVSAVHPMGGALIKPMQTTRVPFEQTKVAGEQIFKCGPWEWEYIPLSRELFVRIVIDYKTENCPAVIVGQLEEVFVGPFNEDFTEWEAEWFSSSEFIVTEPITGKSMKTVTGEDEVSRGTLAFKKL